MTTLLSRYKIIKQIGTGGFGDTHLAEDTALPGNPHCVVKHLRRNPDPDALAVAQRLFEHEAKILHNLGKHDQIPSLAAHFQENGEFYLVQEFIDGDDLNKEIIPGKKLSEQQTIKLLIEILEILAVVHQQNIIHRDIKPSNIMRRRQDSKIVLIDFGAVKEIGSYTVNSQGQTSLTVSIGTPGYMPDEQAGGKPRFASDIYAVGIIGIQAVTGLIIGQFHEDSNTGEIIWRNYAKVSDKFAEVLNKMVSGHFTLRYKNATEALQALIQSAKTTAISPQQPPPLPLPKTRLASVPPPPAMTIIAPPPKKFSPKILVGLGLGVVVTVSFAGVYYVINRPHSIIANSPIPSPIKKSPTSTPTNSHTQSLIDIKQQQLEKQQQQLEAQQRYNKQLQEKLRIQEEQQRHNKQLQERLRMQKKLRASKNQAIISSISERPQRGMWVIKVNSNSEADLAGIRPGQLLVSLNNVYIDTVSTANRVVSQNINQPITALLWDNGNQLTLTVTPRDNLIGVLLCRQDRCINGRSN